MTNTKGTSKKSRAPKARELNELDRQPFGERLVRKVAEQLRRKARKPSRPPEGLYHIHRDYCGHGLVYWDQKYHLLEIHDGMPDKRRSIASWDDEQSFVSFWSCQSDYGCSGADPAAAPFHTVEPSKVNNQRIARKRLQEFVGGAACPYCGGLLRSATAKQCPECLLDWHDPQIVRKLS